MKARTRSSTRGTSRLAARHSEPSEFRLKIASMRKANGTHPPWRPTPHCLQRGKQVHPARGHPPRRPTLPIAFSGANKAHPARGHPPRRLLGPSKPKNRTGLCRRHRRRQPALQPSSRAYRRGSGFESLPTQPLPPTHTSPPRYLPTHGGPGTSRPMEVQVPPLSPPPLPSVAILAQGLVDFRRFHKR